MIQKGKTVSNIAIPDCFGCLERLSAAASSQNQSKDSHTYVLPLVKEKPERIALECQIFLHVGIVVRNYTKLFAANSA
ncbi:hypothetical protein SCA6_017214 [Theobroma cacao]